MADWQPIETAPKDGTRVLVYQPGHLHMIGTYGAFGYYFGPHWWSNGVTIAPTHWMPLPEFPSRCSEVRADGGCLYCDADQGETHRANCRAALRSTADTEETKR